MAHSTVSLLDVYARRMELPIVGASIGRKDDRSTWRLRFSEAATQSDRDKEAETIENFDEEAETVLAHESDVDTQLDEPVVSALIEMLASETSYTSAQLRALMKTEMIDP